MSLLQSLTRILAFVGKELVEVIRRPSALLTLVLGPFVIMAIFGLGYQGVRPAARATIVVPRSSGLPTDPQTYGQGVSGLVVEEVTSDQAAAETALRNHQVDAVIVFPSDLAANFGAGQQSTIDVEVSLDNPTDLFYAGALAQEVATRTNGAIIAALVAGGEHVLAASSTVTPALVAAPTRAEVHNLAPVAAGVVVFFGPAVLILILQHLCITLVALSVLRERTSGVLELYRVGPTSAWEIIVGKLLAFMVTGSILAGISLALLVFGLRVPFLGAASVVAAIIGLVLLASIGVGLLLGVLSDSERTAVQGSLLILLASVFFSGFIIELNLFSGPVQALADLLPVTHGINLLQGALLFGTVDSSLPLAALVAIAAITTGAAWLLLRRSMAAGG